jgi:hypothetical protein
LIQLLLSHISQSHKQISMPSLSALTPSDLEEPLLPIFLDRAEVCDKLSILRAQEETTYKVKDYLAETSKERKKVTKPVDADCRVKMCEWCYQVVSKFDGW